MPKLWTETIETHRREVRDAILDATAELVEMHGLLGVTMSSVAEATGIGRATLYKYFPDIESILREWHQRQIDAHLSQLLEVRDGAADPAQRLDAVLSAFALISQESRGSHDGELAALMHRDPHVRHAEDQLHRLVQDLVSDAVEAGAIRDDVPPGELAAYCLHALAGAGGLPSRAAALRLVDVTLDGLRA